MLGLTLAEWLWYGVGGLIALVGVGLVVLALVRPRGPRGRHCPKCLYDMRSTKEMRCPECGHDARSERAMLRRQFRWRWATFGVLMMFIGTGVGAHGYARQQTHGWWSLMPTDVLLNAVGYPGTGDVVAELRLRFRTPPLPLDSAEEQARFLRALERLHRTRPPPDKLMSAPSKAINRVWLESSMGRTVFERVEPALLRERGERLIDSSDPEVRNLALTYMAGAGRGMGAIPPLDDRWRQAAIDRVARPPIPARGTGRQWLPLVPTEFEDDTHALIVLLMCEDMSDPDAWSPILDEPLRIYFLPLERALYSAKTSLHDHQRRNVDAFLEALADSAVSWSDRVRSDLDRALGTRRFK